MSLMSQYRPCYQAAGELRRPLSAEEYDKVLSRARQLDFDRMFVQPETFGPDDHLFPDFDLIEPFRWTGRPKKA